MENLEARERAAKREAERLNLESKIEITVLEKTSYSAHVKVVSKEFGETLRFHCRNVFDVGYVINPTYAIVPSMKPGGIVNGKEWMDFRPGSGRYPVRLLTEFELLAIRYLGMFSPIPSGIRM